MPPPERLLPFSLLGLLTLGAGLGVGLGLSEAPLQYPASPSTSQGLGPGVTCVTTASRVDCQVTSSNPTGRASGPAADVPRVVGLTLPSAISALSNAGFWYSVTYVPGSEPAGTVVSQSPVPGTPPIQGSSVGLEVVNGLGSSSVVVPDVIGTAPSQARVTLNLADLQALTDEVTSTTAPASLVVVAQSPPPGSIVAQGSPVTIDVAPPG
jgi:beta-lactam-binding protein with PASTA domain